MHTAGDARRAAAFARRAFVRSACVAFAAACALAGAARPARAFCRTTTSAVPPDFQPSEDQCWTQGLPLWWRNACVSYDIQKDASRQVSYDDAANAIAAAFAKWTGTTCPTDGTGPSRVSIDVRDLGPVDCSLVQYNSDQGNQHVIVFRDDSWPHNDANNTLALTTVTFDPDTGEIYDADMEINSAQVTLTLADPVPADGYDFESIVTHETGHFLGMAHSGDLHATMFAHYDPGSTLMRTLTEDDTTGICSIYPPDGTRSVGGGVASNDAVAEGACDPTPRHGFSTQCGSADGAVTARCSLGAPPGMGDPPGETPARRGSAPGLVLLSGTALAAVFARRRQRSRAAL